MVDRGRVTLTQTDQTTVELLLWTCNKCGFTMLFDLDVARSRPWVESGPGSVVEEPVDP